VTGPSDDLIDVSRRLAELRMAAIEDYARAAARKGFNLAVSPPSMGEVPRGSDPAKPYIFNVKTDTRLLRPGETPPAGWTLYDFASNPEATQRLLEHGRQPR
jgi:hypothetical protein